MYKIQLFDIQTGKPAGEMQAMNFIEAFDIAIKHIGLEAIVIDNGKQVVEFAEIDSGNTVALIVKPVAMEV